ncbi:hypothetical protein FRC14_005204 [Serendipita sp. 396]|nr:hypothetical protein FRC14_005204 [Serendipita sp. 396]KAG8780402.1 hypothetical protein FRC15_009593 [Serendipita sp. 397]KAG8819803.1 hypothetical protein FRC18_011913 [Serendipita sp. 400]KAG8824072.1 hypothetical protein FRC19_002613 [Serendipita sp. 401]KAG8850561.1 hypothetical protein FRB91_008944 [Serendipita sp. 411]KAG9055586.1 hypothetical protein FS842_001779 [Serendipita sp. 407]
MRLTKLALVPLLATLTTVMAAPVPKEVEVNLFARSPTPTPIPHGHGLFGIVTGLLGMGS